MPSNARWWMAFWCEQVRTALSLVLWLTLQSPTWPWRPVMVDPYHLAWNTTATCNGASSSAMLERNMRAATYVWDSWLEPKWCQSSTLLMLDLVSTGNYSREESNLKFMWIKGLRSSFTYSMASLDQSQEEVRQCGYSPSRCRGEKCHIYWFISRKCHLTCKVSCFYY